MKMHYFVCYFCSYFVFESNICIKGMSQTWNLYKTGSFYQCVNFTPSYKGTNTKFENENYCEDITLCSYLRSLLSCVTTVTV